MVRDALRTDVPAITRIMNQGIDETTCTLEIDHKTEGERAAWMAARGPRHPVIVAVAPEAGAGRAAPEAGAVPEPEVGAVPEHPTGILGWASLNVFRPQPGYDGVADISVYIDRDVRGRGIGRQLLDELERRARSIGFHKLVLAAMPDNERGRALYTRVGFMLVGTYGEQGFRDGVWRDVIIMEKLLG